MFGGLGANIALPVSNSQTLQRAEGLVGAIDPQLGQIVSALAPTSWYAKAAARNDPHLHIDWLVQMPWGFPAEMVESMTAPILEYGSAGGIFRGGTFIYIPELGDIGTLNLTFYEDNKFNSTNYLTNWRNLIGFNGIYNYPVNYKKTIAVAATDVVGNVIGVFRYHGCWPQKSQGGYTLGSDSSERTTVAVEFAVDYMSVTTPMAGGSASSNGLAGFLNPNNLISAATSMLNNGPVSIVGSANSLLNSVTF